MRFSLLLLYFTAPMCVFAQFLKNPSFEGLALVSMPPPEWEACGAFSTPDTHPTTQNWNFTKAASDGNTYLGLVMRGSLGYENDNLTESAGAKLVSPFLRNKCYSFSIDLSTFLAAKFDTGFDVITYDTPGRIAIWASNSKCEKNVLIWRSPVISNEDWKTFSFEASFDANYTYLVLEASYADEKKKMYGNISVDNFRISNYEIDLGEDKVICDGSEIQINAPGNVESVKWLDNSTSNVFSISTRGVYWATLQKGNCVVKDTIIVKSVTPLKVDLGRDTSMCIGDILVLKADFPNASFDWNNGAEVSQLKVAQPGTYSVTVTNACNSSFDEINVTYRDECCQITVPNVFTPNNDSFNDAFEIKTESSLMDFQIRIYNRWGKEVFTTVELNNFWNGLDGNEETSAGVYFWTSSIKCNHKNQILEKTYRGHVTLFR